MGKYKEVAATKKYFKYAECDVGDVLVEGTFLREFMGKYGVQYEFEDTETGNIHVLNGSGGLKYKMEFVREGDDVRIVYDGMVTLEKGPMAGKSCHNFKLFRAADDETTSDEGEGSDDEFDL